MPCARSISRGAAWTSTWSSSVRVDAFTLFPQWFDWFREQRHIRNAIELGSSIEAVDYRDWTTLSGRSVDDTPFGGGAGMVLRVDVVDWALQGRYGVDAAALREHRRVIA